MSKQKFLPLLQKLWRETRVHVDNDRQDRRTSRKESSLMKKAFSGELDVLSSKDEWIASYGITWKRPQCWEKLKAKGEEGTRGWDGSIASPIQRIGTWANSRRWWETGRPGVLQSIGLQRVEQDLATEQQQQNLGHDHCAFEFSYLSNESNEYYISPTHLIGLL